MVSETKEFWSSKQNAMFLILHNIAAFKIKQKQSKGSKSQEKVSFHVLYHQEAV